MAVLQSVVPLDRSRRKQKSGSATTPTISISRSSVRTPNPSAIKTSITRRDNIWADDWVGISLDALGTGQTSYHLMVNPNGVQLDMLNTVSGGEDQAVDYVWDSAGRRNAQGYAVEMRVPLQTDPLEAARACTWKSSAGGG